jgi:hypothetical protein
MPRHDPYMNDRNVRSAAGLQLVAGIGLGAGLGWAIAGWFEMAEMTGCALGAVAGFVIASILLYQYGGRSTR